MADLVEFESVCLAEPEPCGECACGGTLYRSDAILRHLCSSHKSDAASVCCECGAITVMLTQEKYLQPVITTVEIDLGEGAQYGS
jgi:hypothetical protein